MAIKLENDRFACSICGTVYASPAHADGCRDSHQLVYVPMSKTELNRLLNAIALDDMNLVPPHLISTLQKYSRFVVSSGS
jgi:hypothetical protein